ncbi:sedoheptulose 7-phosphate cyclase [Pseudomonas soli]|uniref:Sedoheptulose 7-phosphate cyclase n=1 Tax=Pseudomonas soli TaxID=1306993 RepID=A0AAJ5SRS7_9PSED|nr:sedoheptulose 7-phosphate cyclase [Pseudomonas soli]MDW9404027.1 iron-containing alcohol dehydrogenase [Pseudomonas soli]PYC41752.1 3-dehydroquinate synthase [Pseudomonas soli]UXZ43973.1 sedoheptulose 7-phosphate cyclase [Pseudomonas soli]
MEVLSNDHSHADNHTTCQQWIIKGCRPVEYSVIEAPFLFDSTNIKLAVCGSSVSTMACEKRLIFIDSQVLTLHGARIRQFFSAFPGNYLIVPIHITERLKDYSMVEHILQQMVDFGVSRKDEPVIAIGGGCLMDVVGMAASLYRRGVPYIRIPTTLLGIVDAAVGVKTGSNFGPHKNRIGSYYAPICALLDTSFLETLPPRHIKNGMAEILKMAIIADHALFTIIEMNVEHLMADRLSQSARSLEVVRSAVDGMLKELEPNLWESDLQRLVDFGHTLSPVFEMKAVDTLLHGEAVAVDMCISTLVAMNRKLLDSRQASRIIELTQKIGLPIIHPTCTSSNIDQALAEIVKHRDGLQRMPVPIAIGRAAFLHDVTAQECIRACEQLRSIAQHYSPA